MKAAILCVGKLRERFYAEAVSEYIKRSNRLMPMEIIEVPDLPEPTREGDAPRTINAEGKSLLEKLKPGDYIIALCIGGKRVSSEAFAKNLENIKNSSVSRVVFIIGGSLGLSDEVIAKAREKLSLSDMTLPHQLARVVLAEQIYRALKINAGERYHK